MPECEECGMDWEDPNHRTREVKVCETCGKELQENVILCAEDYSHIECEECFEKNFEKNKEEAK